MRELISIYKKKKKKKSRRELNSQILAREEEAITINVR